MKVTKRLCAPNGFLHAASVVALAETACGYAMVNNLPAGAQGFTTIELKTNFIGTALQDDVRCVAELVHKGRRRGTKRGWFSQGTSEIRGNCTNMTSHGYNQALVKRLYQAIQSSSRFIEKI